MNNTALPPLAEQMKCGVITKPNGEIAITSESVLNGTVEYVEYDDRKKSLSVVYDDGRVQDLGLPLDDITCRNVANGTSVTLIRAKDGKAYSAKTVVFLNKSY